MQLKFLGLLLMASLLGCEAPIDHSKLSQAEQELRESASDFCSAMRFESSGERRVRCEDTYIRGQMGLIFGFSVVDRYKGYRSSFNAEMLRRAALLCANDKIFADHPEWASCGRIKFDLLMAASHSQMQATIAPIFIPAPIPQPPVFQPSPPIYQPPVTCQIFGTIVRCR